MKKKDLKLVGKNFYINRKGQLHIEFKNRENREEYLNKKVRIYQYNYVIKGRCYKLSKSGIYLENFSISKI